jgi:hypothetical protein
MLYPPGTPSALSSDSWVDGAVDTGYSSTLHQQHVPVQDESVLAPLRQVRNIGVIVMLATG